MNSIENISDFQPKDSFFLVYLDLCLYKHAKRHNKRIEV